MRSSWVTPRDPKSNDMCPHKSHIKGHTQRRPCDHGGRDWSYAIISQGMQAATRCWKNQRKIPYEPREGAWLCQHLDLRLRYTHNTIDRSKKSSTQLRNKLLRHTITWIDLKGILLSKKVNIKRSHTVGFHLYNIIEMAKL